MNNRPPWTSTATLVSLLLCVLSWELTAALFVGRWLFGPQWLGPHREWAALLLSASFTVFHPFIGRNMLQTQFQRGDQFRRSLTAGQVVVVVVMMVAAGAFGTWLFCQTPGGRLEH